MEGEVTRVAASKPGGERVSIKKRETEKLFRKPGRQEL